MTTTFACFGRVFAAVALLLAALAPLVHAQGSEIPDPETLVRASADRVTIAAGGTAAVTVKLAITANWHINANPPALDYMIPTTVVISAGDGVTARRVAYPAPKKQKFAFEESELLVYDGEASVKVPLVAAAGAALGPRTLEGKVRYQACNDQVCLAPVEIPFEVEVMVTAAVAGAPTDTAATMAPTGAGETADTLAAATGLGAATPATGSENEQKRLETALAQGGPAWFLLLFGGGLLLNLTPCVFPMLGVTVSIFGARRSEPLPKVLMSATAYVLGIAVMYSALGVVAALTGSLFGAALQNVWVNVGLGVLMIALSLSMFGVYEIQPPAAVMQRLGSANTASLAGIFMSGLGVGVIAAPCVGPFLLAVLALIAQRQDVAFGFLTMFTIALGLGLPYLVLGTFSNLLQKLPRSGGWMVWVKKVFGVVLVGVGFFYVALGLIPRLSGWVMPVTLVLGGLYLGFLDRTAMGSGFKRFKLASGVLAILAGIAIVATTPPKGIAFAAYDAMAIAGDLPRSRPVILEFSADWCLPCHELERNTFSDRRVAALAREFDAYKIDLTRYNSPESNALRQQYEIKGVPAIVFLDTHAREVRAARVENFLKPDEFLARMRIALGASNRVSRE